MNAALLLEHWPRLIAAPGAIPAIRRLILDLAVRGKLTADWRAANPGAEPASQLLKRIQTEKAKLIAEKKLRPEKPLPKIADEEAPFEVPEGWVWCRFGQLIEEKPRNGVSLQPVDHVTSAKTLKLSATSSGTFDGTQCKYLDLEVEADSHLWLRDGDILIQRANSLELVGTVAIYRGADAEFIYPDLMMKCRLVRPDSTEYVHYVLSCGYTRAYFRSRASGSAGNMPKVNQETVANSLVPLPSLPEQAAIVERVAGLMQLCDQLEAAQGTRESARQAYLAAGYANVADAEPAEASALLGELLQGSTKATHLKALQQTILTLAIQGKLTADWRAANPRAEPASQLLKRIQAEKAKLIAEKKLRPEKPLPKIADGEAPFAVPEGWAWCRFGHVQAGSDAGSSPKCEERPVMGSEWGILKVSATSGAVFRGDQNKFFQTEAPHDLEAALHEGDFILSRANTKELAGNSVIVEDLKNNLLLSDKTIRFRLSAGVSPRFANLVNKADFVRKHFITHATGASPSMKNLSRESITGHLFPLPPLAEQAAIVERVEALMSTCRALEAELEQSRACAGELLQTVLKEAFQTNCHD